MQVVVDVVCPLDSVELLADTGAAVRQAARDKVLAADEASTSAAAAAAAAPAKGAKGKAGAEPVAVAPVARDLTPEEAAEAEAEAASSRRRLLSSAKATLRVEVVLVLDGAL